MTDRTAKQLLHDAGRWTHGESDEFVRSTKFYVTKGELDALVREYGAYVNLDAPLIFCGMRMEVVIEEMRS